jgi:hypothetical protein
MMRRWNASAIKLAAVLSVVAAGRTEAEIFSVSGRVVTCPVGNPIQEMPVTVYFNGVGAGVATTNSNGQWSVRVSFVDCDPIQNVFTAVFGSQQLIQPYDKSSCPLGRHGTPPSCCVQVVTGVECGDYDVQMPDLQLRCGVPGAPPCPSVP